MTIDTKVVEKIAKLSRLKLTLAQTETIAKELSEVLSFVQKLEEVDTSSISPMTTVTPVDRQKRSDEIADGNYPEKILKNAPEVKEGFFSVPKVVE